MPDGGNKYKDLGDLRQPCHSGQPEPQERLGPSGDDPARDKSEEREAIVLMLRHFARKASRLKYETKYAKAFEDAAACISVGLHLMPEMPWNPRDSQPAATQDKQP